MSNKIRVALLFLCVLAASQAGYAQYFGQNKVQYRRFDFRILQTKHFDIYYYPEEQEVVYQAARMAERWYDHISRVLDHQLHERQPLVLYASHPDFSQTNVVPDSPGEGTGGFTEADRNRVVLPFGASLAETNHVLGHELVHAFQYDIGKHGNAAVLFMPLWFIEGMAEYVSIGGMDGQTTMWLRDAVHEDKLPTVKDLSNPRFFPYRYGQAFWSYLAGRFGEQIVPRLLKLKGDKVSLRLKSATGVSAEQLSRDWHDYLRATYSDAVPVKTADTAKEHPAKEPTDGSVRRVITAKTGGRMNVGPSLSPDGRMMVFLSEKDQFSVDMYLADARTGAIINKVISTATDPHFDSLEFLDSAGAWDPSGRLFAFTGIRHGSAVLVVVNPKTGRTEREVRLPSIGQASNATWSPDSEQIAFSGLSGGQTDLYVYSMTTREVRALTHDEFADFQPAWSPDGKTIAFVTDRFSLDLRNLEFGNYRMAALDVETGEIREVPGIRDGRNLDPHWSADGKSLFFVASPKGTPNIYRVDLATYRVSKVTDMWNGVAGVTPISPVFSVAADRQELAFSVYRASGYEIQAIDGREKLAGQAVPLEETTAPGARPLVEATIQPLPLLPLADNPAASLQDAAVKRYRKTLSLDRIAQPYFSAGGGSVGSFVQAGMGLSFQDMLGDQQFDFAFQVGRRRDDFAGQAVYLNRFSRFNYGLSVDYLPAVFAKSESTILGPDDTFSQQTDYLRQIHTGAAGLFIYPFNRSQRLEMSGGFEHITFAREYSTNVYSVTSGNLIRKDSGTVSAAEPITYGVTSVAFVGDTAILGPTSPILGTRYRFELAPSVGGLNFATVLADYRRYEMPVKPFTIAMRARYLSRFGADASDPRLLPLVWTLRGEVRGYDLQSLISTPCSTTTAVGCASVDYLGGSRLFVGNVELRFPLLGALSRTFNYGPIPMEGIVFLDAGSLWTHHSAGAESVWTQRLLGSFGAGVRVNAGGMILEFAAARPHNRPDARGWTFSFNVFPGF